MMEINIWGMIGLYGGVDSLDGGSGDRKLEKTEAKTSCTTIFGKRPDPILGM
ncbi:hypothetical protein [Lysinibacillus capsici]|uniref:hypothetical protein n=1 Tax=Lysinibacillus capsici TaxID=2115968 RepID=UPI00289F4024|nr:hypothetical protein [Lysinibacillus capsici]